MSMFNDRAASAVIGAAILAGTGIYLVEEWRLQRLQAENHRLLAQQQELRAQAEEASKATQAAKEQLKRLQQGSTELLRLRNEVGQLRGEREAAKRRASQLANTGQSSDNPGRYTSKDQLAFTGYATPEAALESMVWAVTKGSYDQVQAGFDPKVLKDESRVTPRREDFERQQGLMAAGFKGMQIAARKTLDGDRVELKVKMDFDAAGDRTGDQPPFMIETMVKVGGEWKSAGMIRRWQPEWDQDGQIQPLAP